MPAVSIKKRISFDFLGEGYGECYALFKPIPIIKYKDFINSDKKSESDNIDQLISLVQSHFVSGRFKDDDGKLFDLAIENIEEFDLDSIIQMFNLITGRTLDPKA